MAQLAAFRTGLALGGARIQGNEGPDITLPANDQIAAQLAEAALVDGYQFVIIPIALGALSS